MEIVGISEVRWKDQGDQWMEDYRIIHAGDEKGFAGVGIVLNKYWGKRVKSVVLLSERIMLVKLFINDKENLAIIQTYFPTSAYTDEEVEEVYDQLDEVLDLVDNNDTLIVLGDWNAVVGDIKEDNVTGNYGYGRRNRRGQRLIDFCKEKDFIITNTLFKQPVKRRYTWTKPGGTEHFQIDYIIVRRKHMKCVLQSKTYPGADITSDHNLLSMKFRLMGRKQRWLIKNKQSFDTTKLRNMETKQKYQRAVKEEFNNVVEPERIIDVNEKWTIMKDSILKAANKTLGATKNPPRKPWIDGKIIELIEERRKHKNAKDIEGKIRYKHWKNLVNRECKKAKEEWLKNLCEEIDTDLQKGKLEKAYSLIHKYFGKKKMMTNSIEDEHGRLLVNENDIVTRWKNYIETLYDDNNDLKDLEEEEESGPEITKDEFDRALNALKGKKACGKDQIPAELIKHLDEEMRNLMFLFIKEVYESGNVPQDFQESDMVIIPKKTKSRKCEDFRTLSILSHTSKILTGIVKKRIERKIEQNLHDDQFGFRHGKGTREAILSLRLLIDESMRVHKPIFIAFVDLQKAFDNINWNLMLEILKDWY
ncbi:hypothetical protein M8J77_001464 [Diaphorina citri]|nr:hypothetical protein M8J77_001464 [Diaphorina citri]